MAVFDQFLHPSYHPYPGKPVHMPKSNFDELKEKLWSTRKIELGHIKF